MIHWEKVEEGWKDLKTGLVWLPKKAGEYTHDEALKLENETERLPTIGELRTAWEHSAHEVMGDWGYWFWSSSVLPGVSPLAYVLNGYSGYFYSNVRSYNVNAVRCVRR